MLLGTTAARGGFARPAAAPPPATRPAALAVVAALSEIDWPAAVEDDADGDRAAAPRGRGVTGHGRDAGADDFGDDDVVGRFLAHERLMFSRPVVLAAPPSSEGPS